MKELLIFIGIIISFLLSMIIGQYIYFLENKKKFNLLNSFPFEMISKKNNLNLIFRILLGVFISISCIDILYLFIYHYDSNFLSRFSGIVLILEAFMILGVFIISSILYKGHIVISSLLFILNIISFVLIGYRGLLEGEKIYIAIIAFVIGFIELLILFLPQFKNGFKLIKEDDEFVKPKFNLYSFFEWVNIFSFIISIFLYTINYL